MKKWFYFLVCLSMAFTRLNAGHEKGSQRFDLKNYTASNTAMLLQDDKYSSVNALVVASTPSGFFDYSYKNRLVLGIDKYIASVGSLSTALGGNRYSAEVIVTLNYNQLSTGAPYAFNTISVPCTLKVNNAGMVSGLANVDNGTKETDLDAFVYDRGYLSFVTVNAVKIYNASNTLISTSVYPDNLYLELQYDAERYYDMNTAQVPYTVSNQVFIKYYNGALSGNQIEVNWQRIPGAEAYDLEWVWVDEYSYSGIGNVTNPLWQAYPTLEFKGNSTRVRTSNNYYRISNTFESGYVFFRLRGVGQTLTPGALTALGNPALMDYYTPWTWNDLSSLPTSTTAFSPATLINSSGTPVITSIPVGGGLAAAGASVPWFINLTASGLNLEPNKNWVYKASYAEEGKKKEVVSFFDGAQFNRQSVTVANSENVAIVAETYYDFLGRAVVQPLPTPVEDASIQFYQQTVNGKNGFNFENVSTNPRPFTKDVFALAGGAGQCSVDNAGLSNQYGTGKYYSANTNFISSSSPFYKAYKTERSYTPDGENYPFTQTQFKPDARNLVSRQSGVGEHFKLHTNASALKHDTRTFYDVPLQEELDRLFGSEAGYAKRYTKTTVVDPNGQASISYLNTDNGKVVATALSGASYPDLMALQNSGGTDLSQSATVLEVDLLNKANAGDADKPNDNNEAQNGTLLFSQKVMVVSAASYSFDYSLSGASYNPTLCPSLCYDCAYDLTFDITDACGNRPANFSPVTYSLGHIVNSGPGASSQISPIDRSCNDVVNFKFQQILSPGTNSLSVFLNQGEYTVYKKLSINQWALTESLKDFLANCPKTLADFQADESALVDVSGCNMSCEKCVSDLGSLSNYITTNTPAGVTLTQYQTDSLKAEFNALVEACREPCKYVSYCDAAYESLLLDVSPNGQYAEFEAPGNTVDASLYPLSLLNQTNQLSKRTSGNQIPSWKFPEHHLLSSNTGHYYDEDNVTISKIQVSGNGAGGYLPPLVSGAVVTPLGNNLFLAEPKDLADVSDFIQVWKPSWARSLVKYHPEYCYYEWCIQNRKVNVTPVSVTGYNLNAQGNYDPLSSYQSNYQNSEGYDSLLVAVEDLSGIASADHVKLLKPLANDPYWSTNGYYSLPASGNPATNTSPLGMGAPNVAQMQNANGATPVDFSASGLYYPFNTSYKTANNRFWNFQGSGLNLYQFAAIASTTLAANMGQGAASLLSLLSSYPGYAGNPPVAANPETYILNLQDVNNERRKAWEYFKGMYLSLKQELQQEAAQSYVMNSNCRGCNDCIGKPGSNVWEVPFTSYSLYFNWSAYPSNITQYFTAFINNWFFNYAALNTQQQCGVNTKDLYDTKIKRFTGAKDARALIDDGGGNALASIYNSTGLCPNAFYFQNFLNDLVQPGASASLLSNVSNLMGTTPSFNQDLYLAVTGGNPGTAPADYVFSSFSGSSLSSYITIGTYPNCNLSLNFNAGAMPLGYPGNLSNWSSYSGATPVYRINGLYNLTATGANSFKVIAKVFTTATPVSSYTMELSGTTCITLNGCSFPPPCKLNGTGKAVRDLLVNLAANNQLGSGSAVAIGGSAATTGSPYNATFNNSLKPFLETGSVPGTTWNWQHIGGNVFTVDDGSSGSGANAKLKITFTSVNPSSGFLLSCINSLQNFKADPAVNGGFIVTANVANSSVSGCPNGTYQIYGTVETGNNLSALQPLNIANCSFELQSCNTPQHDVKRDLQNWVMQNNGTAFGTLINSSSQNLTGNANLTLLLRSYLGSNVNVSTSGSTPPVVSAPQHYYHWVKDAGGSTPSEVKGWFVKTSSSSAPALPLAAGACQFSLKYRDTPFTSANVGSYLSLGNFSVLPLPLSNNSGYSFSVTAYYTGSPVNKPDTLVGYTSCFPMRACESCTTQPTLPGGQATSYV
ncbi:MAG: hypothetical protein QM534_15860, partial [Sediminibacterium sp.]|nr:hypothetical protein [Sediminibacterium sp.]